MAKLVKSTSNIDLNLQLPSLTSDPKKCEGEPTFIFYSEHFDVLDVEIG